MAETQVAAPPKEAVPPINTWILPVAAAWLVPGLGHFLLKKTGRGALLFASIALMFLFGLFMRGMMFTPEKGADYLTSLINYGGFVCDIASGALYLCAAHFRLLAAGHAGRCSRLRHEIPGHGRPAEYSGDGGRI